MNRVKQELLLTPREKQKIYGSIIEVSVLNKWDFLNIFLEAQLAKAEELIRKDERKRIIKYLKIRWRCYESNEMTGVSRHTFVLPEDWRQALKGKDEEV